MIYRRLAALFGRYCATHLVVSGAPAPLVGDTGQRLGHIDRLTLKGTRVIIEGWADADHITLSHAGARHDLTPSLPRHDVSRALPDMTRRTPGFAASVPGGDDDLVVTLSRGGLRLIYRLPMPSDRAVRRARWALLPGFVRAMAAAAPAIVRFIATQDPGCRARLKRHLRLDTPAPSRAMQSLLFLDDSLAKMPVRQQAAERARLQATSLAHRAITIILPIYNAFDLLPEVLTRVVQHTDLPWRLILIDDASTDDRLRPFLRRWVATQTGLFPDRISLIENRENLGFIGSVNLGLKQALTLGGHVVLLNSDALVPQGWASRLMRPFLAHDSVASVTPMSNDAEIFSAPVICQRSPLAAGEADRLDETAARLHPDASLADAPTGVGFCMAMSIDYLRRIPQLDTRFGRGYGEEVDWCQKARALGGRHLGLANLFVEHRGGTSFGSAEKQRLIAQNGAIISRRYPGYDADVQRFVAQDPLAASRLALAIAWAAGRCMGPMPIYLAHSMGGGAQDYLAQRISADLPQPALVLRVGTAFRWQLELHSAQGITQGATDDFTLIQRMLDPVKRLRIVYSCGVGDADPATLPDHLLALQRGADDSIEMLIHDYLPISPSYTLLGEQGCYRGVPDATTTDAAHRARRPDGRMMPLADWQAAWGRLIERSAQITVFSANSAQIVAAAYPAARPTLRIIPHQLLVNLPRVPDPVAAAPRVFGVLGNIGLHKGAAVLQELAARPGMATLVVLGRVDPSFVLARPARVHGGYQRADIPGLIARYGITDWLIPSIWPETFSYTTHEAIATGLPVWGFDLGAQADAIRAHGRGGVIAMADGKPDLAALLAAVCAARAGFAGLKESVAA